MTNAERLNEARALLFAVMRDLDTKQTTCSCCGLVKAENWPEQRAHGAIGGLMTKITKLLDTGEPWLKR